MIASLQSPAASIARYLSVFQWFVGDVFRNFPWRLIGIIVAQFVGVTCQAAALSILVYLINRIESESGEVSLVGGISLDPNDLFVGATATAFFVLVVAGVITFYARRQTIGISLDYETSLSQRLLRSFGVLPTGIASNEQPLSTITQQIRKINSRDTNQAGRALRILLRGSSQFAVFLYALLAALYLAPVGFGLILLVIAIFAVFYYKANVAAARGARRLELNKPRANESWRDAQTKLQFRMGEIESDDRVVGNTYEKASVKKAHDAFKERLTAPSYAELFGNLGLSLALVAALSYLGVQAVAGDVKWSIVLAVMLVIQFAMIAFRGIAQTITSFTRLYPAVQRCRDAMTSDKSNASKEEKLIDPFPIPIPGYGKSPELELNRGGVAHLVTNIPVSRYTVGGLFFVISGGARCVADVMTRTVAIIPKNPVVETAGTPIAVLEIDRSVWDSLIDIMRHLGSCESMVKRIGDDPDRELTRAAWRRLDAGVMSDMLLAASVLRNTNVVFVARSVFEGLSVDKRNKWVAILENRLLLVFTDSAKRFRAKDAGDAVIAVGDAGVWNVDFSVAGAEGGSELVTQILQSRKQHAESGGEDELDED